jgi:hypothetical protein
VAAVREPPAMDDALYAELRQVAPQVHADFDDLPVLAHDCGRRGASVTALALGDADLIDGVIPWRRELDKSGEPARTAIADAAVAQLRQRAARLAAAPHDADASIATPPLTRAEAATRSVPRLACAPDRELRARLNPRIPRLVVRPQRRLT